MQGAHGGGVGTEQLIDCAGGVGTAQRRRQQASLQGLRAGAAGSAAVVAVVAVLPLVLRML